MAAQAYTLAFIFDTNLEQVILITLQKPGWQQHKTNGVGGKLDADESILEATIREIQEETGLSLAEESITPIGTIHNSSWLVHIHAAQTEVSSFNEFSSQEGTAQWHPVDALPDTVIDNLPWLIPLCKNKLQEQFIDTIDITYFDNTHE